MNLGIWKQLTRRISIWLLAALLFCILLVMLSTLDTNFFSFGDFPQYWAAGRLQLLGQNPYDPELVIQLRNEVGQSVELTDSATMMLYPPWILPLLIPLGVLPYPTSRFVWLIVNITLLIYSTQKIWSFYEGPQRKRWVAYTILIIFPPTILGLLFGHISIFFLLSVVIFLSNISNSSKSKASDFISGASLAILTIKPQLLLLVYLVILLWAIHKKSWIVLIGTAGAIILSTGIMLVINPLIIHQYWNTMSRYPVDAWATPTIGMVLRVLFGIDVFWLQFIPTLFGCAWVIYYWNRHKEEWNWYTNLPIVIFVSILTTSYGWTYDYSILLLPLLYGAVLILDTNKTRIKITFFIMFLVLNALVYLLHIRLSDFWFFWYVPSLFVLYYFGVKTSSNVKLESLRGEPQIILNLDEG